MCYAFVFLPEPRGTVKICQNVGVNDKLSFYCQPFLDIRFPVNEQ